MSRARLVAASTAFMTVARSAPFSSWCSAWMVVPPGVQTSPRSFAGCSPDSSIIFAAPYGRPGWVREKGTSQIPFSLPRDWTAASSHRPHLVADDEMPKHLSHHCALRCLLVASSLVSRGETEARGHPVPPPSLFHPAGCCRAHGSDGDGVPKPGGSCGAGERGAMPGVPK